MHPGQSTGNTAPQYTIEGDLDIDPGLMLGWIDVLLTAPPGDVTPYDVVTLLSWGAELRGKHPAKERRPMPDKVRWLLSAACDEASTQQPGWEAESVGPAANLGAKVKTAEELAKELGVAVKDYAAARYKRAKDKILEEIWGAFFAPTNLAGTGVNGWRLIDSLARSLPLTWRVALQGGTIELYDANAGHRRKAFGKAAKSMHPPKMKLRIRGAKLSWFPDPAGVTTRGGATRIPVGAGAKTLKQALKVTGATAMKRIPDSMLSKLKLPGYLGHWTIGLVVTFVPQLIADINSSSSGKEFALATAKNQSGNIAGMLAGAAAGAAVVFFGAVSAPVIITVSIVGGALGQAAFNALGCNEDAEWLMRKAF